MSTGREHNFNNSRKVSFQVVYFSIHKTSAKCFADGIRALIFLGGYANDDIKAHLVFGRLRLLADVWGNAKSELVKMGTIVVQSLDP